MTKTTTKFAIGGACATSLSLALLLAPDPPRRLAQEETAREVVSAPLAGADFDALARRAWETTGGGVPVDREVPFATPPAPAQPADADATPRGTIVVVLLDGANGRQVGPGRLRARGAGRSVDHPFRASPVTLDLVAGSHRLLVHALGFEPLEVGPVDVPAGRTTPLGAYVMERGTAALTGAVRLDGAHLAAGRVELHGAGLHGCTACENGLRTRPCTLCGFAGDRAVRTLEAGRDFRFDGLCAGEYLVAAYDGEDALVGHVPVELARGAEERVEIELTRIDLPLRLVDEQGRPFRGTWTEDGVAYAGPVRVFASDRGLPCGRAVWTPPGVVPADAPAEAAPPTGAPDLATLSKRLLGAPRRTQETLLSAPIQVGAGGPLELSLPSPFPDLRTLPLQLVERAPALHVVLRLPAQSSRLDVACGPWMQSATLDLSRWNGEPITIRMDRRCPSPTPELVGARSCADCHRLPS